MAIDTVAKRRSALATRRLPWFRRFHAPVADGTIDQGDRQQLAFVYRGILSANDPTPRMACVEALDVFCVGPAASDVFTPAKYGGVFTPTTEAAQGGCHP